MKEDFGKPIQVEFTSVIKEGKFYDLNGKEVTTRNYVRYINSMEQLSRAELRFVVLRYSQLLDTIRDLRSDFNKLNI
jgi:hypothetical protein